MGRYPADARGHLRRGPRLRGVHGRPRGPTSSWCPWPSGLACGPAERSGARARRRCCRRGSRVDAPGEADPPNGRPPRGLLAGDGQARDLQRGRGGLIAEGEILPHHLDVLHHLTQVAGDRDLLDRVRELAFDPETSSGPIPNPSLPLQQTADDRVAFRLRARCACALSPVPSCMESHGVCRPRSRKGRETRGVGASFSLGMCRGPRPGRSLGAARVPGHARGDARSVVGRGSPAQRPGQEQSSSPGQEPDSYRRPPGKLLAASNAALFLAKPLIS